MLCCHLLSTFFKINFFKKNLSGTLRASNSSDPDQDQCSVSPDLGQKCLQRLSADDKSRLAASKERVNQNF